MLYLFSRIIVVGSPLWPVTCLATCEVDLKSKQKADGHSVLVIHATIVPVGALCQDSCCSSQESQVGKVDGYFLLQ